MPDATERTWRFVYDERFGSSNMRPRINELEARVHNLGLLARTSGDNGKIKGAACGTGAQVGSAFRDHPEAYICPSSTDFGGDSFVISATDPRGNVTTGEYDDQGNQSKETIRFFFLFT